MPIAEDARINDPRQCHALFVQLEISDVMSMLDAKHDIDQVVTDPI